MDFNPLLFIFYSRFSVNKETDYSHQTQISYPDIFATWSQRPLIFKTLNFAISYCSRIKITISKMLLQRYKKYENRSPTIWNTKMDQT